MLDVFESVNCCRDTCTLRLDDLVREWVGSCEDELRTVVGRAQQIFVVQFLLYARTQGVLEADLNNTCDSFDRILAGITLCRSIPIRSANVARANPPA